MKIKLVDATLMTKNGPDALGFYQKLLGDNLEIDDKKFYYALKDRQTGFELAIVQNSTLTCTCLTFLVDSLSDGVAHLKQSGIKDEDIELWSGTAMKGLYFNDPDGRKMIMFESTGSF